MNSELSRRLLDWYAQHARKLPWRGATDPYKVWVSEIMLQQTRVDTVIPYFQRWLERFPNPAALAYAAEQDVLQAWEGLGYYSRARNLHRAAKLIVEQHGGRLPSDPAQLERLPGVGRYTAAAVASMAFGVDVAALDGNIRRVLARVFNVDLPARSPQGEARLLSLANENLPVGQAGDYNQALMDLGSSICTPRSPLCAVCPLTELCQARMLNLQEQRPVLTPKEPVPHYLVTAAVLQKDGLVMIARRPSKGLLGGMWEFPGGKVEAGESLPEGLKREIREELAADIAVGAPFGVYHHAYTHFKVTLHAFLCRLLPGSPDPRPLEASELRWVPPVELASYPMGKIDRQISCRLMPPKDDDGTLFGRTA